MKKILGLAGLLALIGCFFSSNSNPAISVGAVSYTASQSSFSSTSGKLGNDENITYGTGKGEGSSDPAIYSGVIRLYQGTPGGYIWFQAKSDYVISSVTVTSSMETSVDYFLSETSPSKVGADDFSGDIKSLNANGTFTLNEISTKCVTIACFGTNKKTRLYVSSATVVYSKEETKTLESISVSGSAKKTDYIDGESFDSTGLIVTATYDDGSSEDVTGKVTWDNIKFGDTSISCKYSFNGIEKTATYEGISVSKNLIQDFEISGKLVKNKYYVGETFSPEGLKATAMDSLTNVLDVTKEVKWNLSKFAAEGSYEVIGTYENNGKAFTSTLKDVQVQVAEKTLKEILVDLENAKTEYTLDDTSLDKTGIIVYADYPFSIEDVTSEAKFSEPDLSTIGVKTINVSFGGLSTSFEITVGYPEMSLIYIDSSSAGSFELVNSDLIDWTGTYAIGYVSGQTVNLFNGMDESNNFVPASLVDNKINKENVSVSFEIEKIDLSSYSIKINGGGNDGKYLYSSTDNNGISFSTKQDSGTSNSISFDSKDNAVKISSSNAVLRYNATSGQNRFRYFKSSTYKAQKPISLFKLNFKSKLLPSNELKQASYDSLKELQKCDPSGVNSSYNWALITNNFADLNISEKTVLETAIANGEGNAIERFLEKYDYLVSYKGQVDFLNRKPAGQNSSNIINPLKDGLNVSGVVAAVIAVSGLAIAITFVFTRKRKVY